MSYNQHPSREAEREKSQRSPQTPSSPVLPPTRLTSTTQTSSSCLWTWDQRNHTVHTLRVVFAFILSQALLEINAITDVKCKPLLLAGGGGGGGNRY